MKKISILLLSLLVVMYSINCDNPTTNNKDACNISKNVNENDIKKIIIDEFNPGTSFGMPHPILQFEITSFFEKNGSIVTIIHELFTTRDSSKIYNIAKQLNQIELEFINCKYQVKFTSGNSCIVKEYSGELWLEGGIWKNDITFLKENSIPC